MNDPKEIIYNSPITEEIGTLIVQMDNLEAGVSVLENKLSITLTPPMPKESKIGPGIEPQAKLIHSSLFEDLYSLRQRLYMQVQRIADFVSRLEV